MRYKVLPKAVLVSAWLAASASLVGCLQETSTQQDNGAETNKATATSPATWPERYAMVVGLKPEKIEYYKKLHAKPWPSVLGQITRSHIQNYSIHMVELKPGEYYLFGYLEYTGDDFESDMQVMAADAETVRWRKETDPCQYTIETAKEGDGWTTMEEVFYHP